MQGTDLEMWSSLLHIAYTYVALLYLHRQREQCHYNLFSEIYEQLLFTFHLNSVCLFPLRLRCVFLAKMPNELGSIRTYFLKNICYCPANKLLILSASSFIKFSGPPLHDMRTFFRFIVVYYPLKRSEICTPKRAKIVVISLAIFAVLAYTFAIWTSGKAW